MITTRRAAIIAVARTPFTRAGGALASLRADEALGQLLADVAANRLVLSGRQAGALIVGVGTPEAEQGWLFAQAAARLAQMPEGIPAWCVSAGAASGLLALGNAINTVLSGQCDIAFAAGVDFTSRVPVLGYNPSFSPSIRESDPTFYTPTGMSAEQLVSRFRQSREDLDAWANESRRRAAKARDNGFLRAEIVPLKVPPAPGANRPATVEQDELAAVADMGALAAEEPVFLRSGSLTRRNCAHWADGAAVVAVCTPELAASLSIEPLALASQVYMEDLRSARAAEAPLRAIETLCEREGRHIDEFEAIEIDEPQAAVPLACGMQFRLPANRINPHGGSLAFGNAPGASGLRLVTSLACGVERGQFGAAIAAQYGEGGLGLALTVEKTHD